MSCVLLPLEADESHRAVRLIEAAKVQVRPEASAAVESYISMKAEEIAKSQGRSKATNEDQATARRAVHGGVLDGAFAVPLYDDEGGTEWVPVRELLANPDRYDGRLGPDPLDGEGPQKAKVFAKGPRPCIHSFAHGGRVFILSRCVEWIELQPGRAAEAAEAAAEALNRCPDVVSYGGRVACVYGGTLIIFDKAGLQYLLGSRLQFFRNKTQPNGGFVQLLVDPLRTVVDMMNVPDIVRKLRPINAVITAPTMRLDGTLLEAAGYDASTRLVLDIPAHKVLPVPDRPSVDEALAALDRVLYPVKDFPYVGAADRAVMLAALITAVVRSVLPTAPAFGLDATIQASGKTLLATVIGILASGEAPLVVPHTHGRDDEEVRKRIMALLATAPRCVNWDNVVGVFDSPSKAAMLTSSVFSDRLLGRSETVTVPTRTLWIITGNNLTPAGDLTRRILVCRIDPGTERPYARYFDLNPAEYVRAHRQAMVRDILTILRAYRCVAPEPVPGKMASFEDWDSMVRQPVAWLASMRDDLVDPMVAVDARQVLDPEQQRLASLLDAIGRVCGPRAFETRELANAYLRGIQLSDEWLDEADDEERALRDLVDALEDFNARGGRLSSRSIGRILANRVDRIAEGRCVRRVASGRVATWKIETQEVKV